MDKVNQALSMFGMVAVPGKAERVGYDADYLKDQ